MSDVMATAAGSRASSPETGEKRATRWSRVMLRQETTLVAVIVLIGAFTTVRNSAFVESGNLTEILRSSVIYFVMAAGAALLMIGGGLDFSVGSIFTLGGLVTAWMLVHGVPWPAAIAGGLALGAVVGGINHIIITYLHVPPIIATLGTFFITQGIGVQITGGLDILPLPTTFQQLGQNDVLGVPYIVLYAIAIGAIAWFVLERTRFGINVRALGGNRQAAIGNGLRVARLDFALYAVAGLMAALAGIIYAARVGAGQVEAGGASTTLQVVTATLIGGTSLFGGLGSITGVALGAILLSEIENALVVAHIAPQYNSIVTGAILIAAVAADHVRRERLYRR
ncbi:MAG TPA: ABC transporter permease [Baekduia sp.]